MSNYWVPALYFHAQNGSFINVPQSGGMAVYYESVLFLVSSVDVAKFLLTDNIVL